MNQNSKNLRRSMKFRLGAVLVALATAAALMPAKPAWAAELDSEEAKEARDTIVVTGEREPAPTASKTGTATRDLPASIQTISAKSIEEQAGLVLNEVVRNVPGVQPIYGGGYAYLDAANVSCEFGTILLRVPAQIRRSIFGL